MTADSRFATLRSRTSARRDPRGDVVQDCLERAIARWHQRRPASSIKAWLYTILHNRAVDGRRRLSPGSSVEIDDTPQGAFATPATQDQGLRIGDILCAIDRLPAEQAAVLRMIGVEEFTNQEAADELGLPIGTVMSRLSRGRDGLRRELGGCARPAVAFVKRGRL
ncbi:MAG: RNA polymerase sigma factor [Janthinobacterium lividum]